MLNNLIDLIKLPFRKEKELYLSLYHIMGFYPRNISYYKLALMHKSIMHRNAKGKPVNNERLEFLGDAMLDAIVGDIVYRHFPGKREGFLTNTRSKLVQRSTLGKLAKEMGINDLVLSSGRNQSHNSFLGGNAFEALVGAMYLDRGYDAVMHFMKKRILKEMVNIDKVAFKEVNFKSKLIEWSQKNRVKMSFEQVSQGKDKGGSPTFVYKCVLEGIEGCEGSGYSKKESQQLAAKLTLEKLRKQPQFIDAVFSAKGDRTKMEEEPVENVPNPEEEANDFIIAHDIDDAEQEKHVTAFRETVYHEDGTESNADLEDAGNASAADASSVDGREPKARKGKKRPLPPMYKKKAETMQNAKLPYASHGDLRFKIQNSAETMQKSEEEESLQESKAQSSKLKVQSSDDPEDTMTEEEKRREEIIAAAEAAAFE